MARAVKKARINHYLVRLPGKTIKGDAAHCVLNRAVASQAIGWEARRQLTRLRFLKFVPALWRSLLGYQLRDILAL